MTILEANLYEDAGTLIWKHAHDQSELDILLFLARHPHTRFTRLAILHVLGSRLLTERVLDRLTESGGVQRRVENGVALYSLGGDAQLQSALLGVTRLDHCKRQRLLATTPRAAAISCVS